MLTNDQIEQLEVAGMWLEEIVHSKEFQALDIHPDLTLGDSLQGINETLAEHNDLYNCPSYVYPIPTFEVEPSDSKPSTKKRGAIKFFGNVAITSLLTTALSVSASIFCWGLSDMDKSLGNQLKPDFADGSQLYRGTAKVSFGIFLGSAILASAIASQEER